VGAKALLAPSPARCLPCTFSTGHTSVCHSATDATDTFQCRRIQFLELCSLVFLNCIQLSIFRGVGQSNFTLITWIKNLSFSERKSKAGDNFHNHVELALSGNIFLFQNLAVYYTSLLVLSCCIKLSIFRCSVQSYFTLITRVKNLCFSLPA